MKTSRLNHFLFSACLTLLLVSPVVHAEIYKWVDANGQTHYSEKKEDAGKTEAVELKVKKSTPASTPSSPSWQEQERLLQQRQAQKQADEMAKPPVDKRPKSLSGARVGDTDESRCNFARDILSGAIQRMNSKTDQNDRDIAQNDIRAYCH